MKTNLFTHSLNQINWTDKQIVAYLKLTPDVQSIFCLTITIMQHRWQGPCDWRDDTNTVGRLKLMCMRASIAKSTQQGMRSYTNWLNCFAGYGVACWSCYAVCREVHGILIISSRWSVDFKASCNTETWHFVFLQSSLKHMHQLYS